jgi:hypothetical protein
MSMTDLLAFHALLVEANEKEKKEAAKGRS